MKLKQWIDLLKRRIRKTAGSFIYYLNGGPSLPPPMTKEEEAECLRRIASGDGAAREKLIEHNLRLVVYIARKFENAPVPTEDLISIGTVGLIKAVKTFCPEKNIKLASSPQGVYSSR